MRSFQVLLAGSNPATRLISSFYLISMLFKSFCYFFNKQKITAACSGSSYAQQGIKSAHTFRAPLFYVIKPKSSMRCKDSKRKEKSCYLFFCMRSFYLFLRTGHKLIQIFFLVPLFFTF